MQTNGKSADEVKGMVDIEGLRVRYGEQEVLRGFDLTIHGGSITAAIGPSGCGKTTLLRCLNRLVDLTPSCHVGGKVSLDGKEIASMDPVLLRRRVGMVFQKPNPFPMSVRENVLYGVKAQRMRRNFDELVESSLRRAALWEEVKDRLDHNAHTLSGGQQQRLCIARCLAVAPEVILMDEPAASLDPGSTMKLEESILAMKGEITVVIVTHDVPEAQRLSDYLVFIYDGQIMEFGETANLFQAPREEMTRDYIAGRLVAAPARAGSIS